MGGTYRCYLLTIQSNAGPWGRGSDGGDLAQGNIDFLNGDPGTSGISTFHNGGSLGTKTIHFDHDTARIVLTGDVAGTFELNTLPLGFRITTKNIKASYSRTGDCELYVRFQTAGGSTECQITGTSGTDATVCTKAVVSTIGTILDGVGARGVVVTLGNNAGFGKLSVTGNYVIEKWWHLNGEYVFQETNPGGYTEVDHPTPVIESMTPSSGPIAGGTAFTIAGDGFLGPDGTPDVEGVTFDGEFPATSVVVVDQHELTGVTPAHWAGGVDVVVSLDFTP